MRYNIEKQAASIVHLLMCTIMDCIFLPFAVKPPKIVVHPQSTRVTYGHSLSLSVQADPSEPGFALEYQWYRNTKPLGGKTDPNIVISSATIGDTGEYFCVVSNQSERTVSKVARVEVINPHTSAPAAPPPPLSSMAAAASSAFIHSSSTSASAGVPPHPTYLKGYWGRGTCSGRGGLSSSEPLSHHQCDDQRHQAPPTVGGDFLSRGGDVMREVVEGGDREQIEDRPSGQPLSLGVGVWDRQLGDTEASEFEKGIYMYM